MNLQLHKGTTSKIRRFFIKNSSVTTGAGLTGLVYNSSNLIAYYIREGDATATAITLAAGTVGTWSSGGFKEVDATHLPGVYELGLPDAALLTGANSVLVMLSGATNMTPAWEEIQLTDTDVNDAQHFGLTGLPSLGTDSRVLVSGDAHTAGVSVTVGINNDKLNYGLSMLESLVVQSGMAQGATATTLTLGGHPSAINDEYKRNVVRIYSGTGAGQARTFTAYDGSTGTGTVNSPWVTVPDTTSIYAVMAFDTGALDLTATAFGEPTTAPPVNASLKDKIGWLYTLARNKVTQTSQLQSVRNDADTTSISTAAVGDDNTTFTRNRWS